MSDLLGFRVLRVDLSTQRTGVETYPRKDFFLHLGGRGLNAKILYEFVRRDADPLGPENALIFGTGKLVGTPTPTAGQLTVTAKSPATGLYFKSNSGGHWAKLLRRAGWDAVVIYGCSPRPTYLYIEDDHVTFCDASALWGRSVRETTEELRRRLGNSNLAVATIGPAGEKRVNCACIMTSTYHAAARGGLGAVMGAKNLKAVAVRGSGSTCVQDERELGSIIMRILDRARRSYKAGLYLQYGTAATFDYCNEGWTLPVRNFTRNHMEKGSDLGGTSLVANGYMRRGGACSSCPLGCHKFSEVKTGTYKGYSGGPEYETLASLGAGCDVSNAEAVLKASELCNDLGMDTISAGGAIQWLIESAERGLVPRTIAGAVDLRWGSGDGLVTLLKMIAHREGIGDLLGSGTRQAADEIGGESWKWAVQANGLEQSRIDTRIAKAYALALAVNPRGPDHLHAQPMAELGHLPEGRMLVQRLLGSDRYCNPVLVDGKPELVRWHEDIFAVSDSLGLCSFATTTTYIIDVSTICALLQAAFGAELSEDDLLRAGERTLVLERCFNLREKGGKQDTLPWRMMNEPVSEGPYKGCVTSESELGAMLKRYYALHRYTGTGLPTRDLLASLGLVGDVRGIEDALEPVGLRPSDRSD